MTLQDLIKQIIYIVAIISPVITEPFSNLVDWSNYFNQFNGDSISYSNLAGSKFIGNQEVSINYQPSIVIQEQSQSFEYQPIESSDQVSIEQQQLKLVNYQSTQSFPYQFIQDKKGFSQYPQLNLFKPAESSSILYRPFDSKAESSGSILFQPKQNGTRVHNHNSGSLLYKPNELKQYYPSKHQYEGPYNPQYGGFHQPIPNDPFYGELYQRPWHRPYKFAHPPAEFKSRRPKLSTKQPIVMTDKGMVRGKIMVSRSGDDYYAFTSIPYAEPPVGQLRFEKPVPASAWKGVKEGPADLPDCWQTQVLNPFLNNITYGTEDCLYLSVFTPQVNKNRKFPVMVFIHGGALRSEFPPCGQAIRSKYIMDEDVVLIVFRYRVGAFGFLSLEDSVLPGNMGLKDSALVLDWVSKNIEGFGGDPNRVTIFGNSVGGVAVHYLLTSPMTKHLVHRGISQSGVATSYLPLGAPGVGRYRASRLAEHLNCPVTPDSELLQCLKSKTAFEVASAERIFIVRDFDPAIPYQPVIESGEDCLICDSPYNVPITKPWITGMVSDEGAFKAAWYLAKPELYKSFEERGAEFLPEAIMYTNITSYAKEISDLIMLKYQGINNLAQIWTDGFFLSGLIAALKRVASPTYLYLFTHRGKLSYLDVLAQIGNTSFGDLGVSHADELMYMFDYEEEFKYTPTPEDIRISKTFIKLWTNFAKFGRPTEHDEWPLYDGLNKQYLNIATEHMRVESNLWPDRSQFWENLPIRNLMEEINL